MIGMCSSTGTYSLVGSSIGVAQDCGSQKGGVREFPMGALGWLHAASTYSRRRIGVDVAVLEGNGATVNVDATSL